MVRNGSLYIPLRLGLLQGPLLISNDLLMLHVFIYMKSYVFIKKKILRDMNADD